MAKEKHISKIAHDMWDYIDGLKPKELKALIAECENLTETNCWWLEYQLREIVSDMAVERIKHSPKTKQKGRKDAKTRNE